MRAAAIGLILALLMGAAIGSLLAATRTRKIDALQQQTTKLNETVGALREELRALIAAAGGAVPVDAATVSSAGDTASLRSAADVETAIRKLGESATAQQLATCLADLDEWTLRPGEEQKCITLKLKLAARLRQRVAREVHNLQSAALEASTGAEAIARHGEAGQVLALYPMSQDSAVLDEAKRLSAQQTEVASRIESTRRQRYNRWASQQIEAAIDGYNKGSSYWSPKKENKTLMDSLVKCLGSVDPSLMEPAVMELYNYVIDLTKGSISEKDKIELAKRLTDPSISRKTLGDF